MRGFSPTGSLFEGSRLGINCQSRLLIRFYFVTPRSSPLRIGEPVDGVFGKDRLARMSESISQNSW